MEYDNTKFHQQYESERLILKILDERYANEVLEFLNEGASAFDEFESEKPSDFYTTSYQQRVLKMEYNLALNKSAVRFYVFKKEDPYRIIGTVSFSFVRQAPFHSAMIGYKFLPSEWHKGYALESLSATLYIVRPILELMRVEAFVLPENRASQKLLSRAGFSLEGTANKVLEVNGIRRDHLQYSYLYKFDSLI
ncbi:MAG: GNAT family N-acetyltransferase [Lachnospiraceae bacterium]|nr:GNAT family N-acetyltransferase [Lachnospiraceae bacterium]MBR4795219.1 GNAT family N-acetyltransferase [Lachnospiraceae bacterium]MBR5789963.1 GNAT family N-acetyltransferase [Lachnospiraceae bacterium]